MTHHDASLTRRAALKGVAGLVIGFHLPLPAHGQSGSARPSGADAGSATIAPNAFIRIGGMLTVVVARSPRFGGKVATFDAADARSIPGVVDVKQLPTGIAVYAEGVWPALKGREALRITWDDAAAEKRSSEQMFEEYRALARRPGMTAAVRGDVEPVLAKAGKVIEAEFVFPYLAHAPMEPLDGFLHWDGERARARFGCQLQTGDHNMIAAVLGLPFERVEIDTMLAGGSFGRRGQADMHLAAELAQAAKAIFAVDTTGRFSCIACAAR